MKKIIVTLMIICLMVAGFAGCSQDNKQEASEESTTKVSEETKAPESAGEEAAEVEETVEEAVVTYWHTMSDAEAAQLETVIAAFEEANPGITVEATKYAYDDFKSAIITSLSGGSGPDTARMDIAWVSQFAEDETLLKLSDEMANFDEIAATVFEGPLSTTYWEDGYYGLPQNTNTQVLLWNRELFEAAGLDAPPSTMDEFKEYAKMIADTSDDVYGYALGGTYFWAPAPIFYTMGGKVTDPDITTATGYVNSAESVAAFTLLKEMYDEGSISPNLLGGGIGTSDGLATNLYGMIIDGPWMVDIYAGQYPDFEVNFAMMPTQDGYTSSVVGGEDVVAFYDTDAKEASLKWIEYLLSEESQVAMAQVGVVPTLKSLVGSDKVPEYFDIFMQQLETAQARVPHPAWGEMDGAINNAFQRILNGDQTVQEALDQAADEINELLK